MGVIPSDSDRSGWGSSSSEPPGGVVTVFSQGGQSWMKLISRFSLTPINAVISKPTIYCGLRQTSRACESELVVAIYTVFPNLPVFRHSVVEFKKIAPGIIWLLFIGFPMVHIAEYDLSNQHSIRKYEWHPHTIGTYDIFREKVELIKSSLLSHSFDSAWHLWYTIVSMLNSRNFTGVKYVAHVWFVLRLCPEGLVSSQDIKFEVVFAHPASIEWLGSTGLSSFLYTPARFS